MKTDRSSAAKALLMPVIAFILCFALAFTVLSAAALADGDKTDTAEAAGSHPCGSNAWWELEGFQGNWLTIYGTGEIFDYLSPSMTPNNPWTEIQEDGEILGKNITQIRVNEGITRIGKGAFGGLPHLDGGQLFLPDTLEVIDDYAFAGDPELYVIFIPASVKYISNLAFPDNLKTVNFRGSRAQWDAICQPGTDEPFVTDAKVVFLNQGGGEEPAPTPTPAPTPAPAQEPQPTSAPDADDPVIPAGTQTFTDVPPEHWAHDVIELAAALGYINGYGDGRFGPNDKLTWEQWAAMLVRACATDVNMSGCTEYFTSYSPWAKEILLKAEQACIFRVYSQQDSNYKTHMIKEYGPDCSHLWSDTYDQLYYIEDIDFRMPINRYNAAAMTVGLFHFHETYGAGWRPFANEVGRCRTTNAFPDMPSTQAFVTGAVQLCVEKGIINGYPDGTFGGDNLLTRAEGAAMLIRLHHVLPSMPTKYTDTSAQLTVGTVKWVTTNTRSRAELYSPYPNRNPSTSGGVCFQDRGYHAPITQSVEFYLSETQFYSAEQARFACNLASYSPNDTMCNTYLLQHSTTCFDLGLLTWNDPDDHSKGYHSIYGDELYVAYMNHDDDALAAFVAKLENDHETVFAWYNIWVNAGKPQFLWLNNK